MSKYIHRILEKQLRSYLNFFSVVGITGPRQSGKSTLLRHTLPDYKYITFDDYKAIEMLHHDPEKFMRINSNKLIFDEAQKVPELFNYIKIAVDNDRANVGKFVLTGSSQFSFVKGISESLAGRIGLLALLPYQFAEIPESLRMSSLIYGGYPELVMKGYKLANDWFSAYLETYLSKDVKALTNIGDLRDFQRLISLLAANVGQILNLSRYANDIGVDVKTIKRWISVLEASYVIFLLPPYHNNYGKRIVKSPKIYFYDTGLVAYLTGVESLEQMEKSALFGALFENYLVSEIIKKETHANSHAELFYYRTSNGMEVDLIIDRKKYKELIEIKGGETFRPKMLEAVEQIIEPDDKGWLLYNGKEKIEYPTAEHKENAGTAIITVTNYKDYLDFTIPKI
jgi:uncharacterized protein